MLTKQEIETLRDLAKKYAQIAALPKQAETREMWRALNRLKMRRPMVLIDQIPWSEMDVDGFLVNRVSEPYWRNVETSLRRTIYQWEHMPADMVINPYICLPRPISNTGWGITAQVDTLHTDGADDVLSQHFANQIENPEDIEKIKMPIITLDTHKEQQIIETAHALFDGIVDFKMTGISMHLGIWDTISMWMGVENCYIELMDRPEMIHQLMEKLTQGLIFQIEQCNRQGLFDVTSNLTHCSHTFSDDLPLPNCNYDAPTSENAWAFGLAQLFTSVSPEITDEFEVQYMKRVFKYFGAIYYGCCDRLDDRLDVIAQLPKVRKISCSPWSDRERFASNLPRERYVMSNKPNPALLVNFNESEIRADLRRTIDAARAHGVNLEMILKDISTVRHDPARLWRWSEIALEEAAR